MNPATALAQKPEELGTNTNNDIPFSLKGKLVDDRGIAYRDFRSGLAPRWGIVWAHIALAHAAVAAILAGLVAMADVTPGGIALGVVGGALIGYALQFLSNFLHEAGHWNLLPDRRANDVAANLMLGWLFGRSVSGYRQVHFQHHRALGTTMDSEIAYFDALRVGYLAAGLLGLKALAALRRWRDMERLVAANGARQGKDWARRAWLAVAAGANLGLTAVLWLGLDAPVAAGAWLFGLLLVCPFLSSLRQLLEHRSEEADPGANYAEVEHGPVNRLFGDGPLASTLGSAGFNRHALHHWEPTVSYTRLGDLERFLMKTQLAPALRERRTTYADTFLRLLEL
jgi:fatty acid desaturase